MATAGLQDGTSGQVSTQLAPRPPRPHRSAHCHRSWVAVLTALQEPPQPTLNSRWGLPGFGSQGAAVNDRAAGRWSVRSGKSKPEP